MPKIKVEAKQSNYASTINSIAFALCTSPPKRKQITPWFTCRDYINDVLIAAPNKRSFSYYTPGSTPYPDYDKLRLLVASQKAAKPCIFTGKSAINVYEKLAGFKGKSVITTLNMDGLNNKACAWLITGPKEWMTCSQLVSLATLVLRLCWRAGEKRTFKNIEELNDFWAALAKSGVKNGQAGSFDINNHLQNYPKWEVLMRNYKSIFKGLSQEDLYPAQHSGNWHGPGGIVSLSGCMSQIKKVDDRFKKALQKAKA